MSETPTPTPDGQSTGSASIRPADRSDLRVPVEMRERVLPSDPDVWEIPG